MGKAEPELGLDQGLSDALKVIPSTNSYGQSTLIYS